METRVVVSKHQVVGHRVVPRAVQYNLIVPFSTMGSRLWEKGETGAGVWRVSVASELWARKCMLLGEGGIW
jgi:hypothetical protein